ncbi:type II toxin-antitoxin system MqsA family antitoxin [Metallumcola ferriviriculae]|uniref:Type II toxin-antitoxin system MqsA family antitoxin n=1 Tax=Metallumcola ferriviriculae TaxID=3039180 RepID=A0AAU0UNL9_9FIRM|nr:type II toxin-antitoxin system MqsA family antitoxin [Desulfitibacteraceae bacterium MK1]
MVAGKILFCPACDEPRSYEKRETTVIHSIKGEDIQVKAKIPFCTECGAQLSDLDVEEKHFNSALQEYCERHNLLLPYQIKKIRKQYGLSQRAFARALGFAESTINRYELGALPDAVHNAIISLVMQPENMIRMAEQNRDNISDKEFGAIKDKVSESQKSSSQITVSKSSISTLIERVEELSKKIDKMEREIEKMSSIDFYSEADTYSHYINKKTCFPPIAIKQGWGLYEN